jgi:hypothetical protein
MTEPTDDVEFFQIAIDIVLLFFELTLIVFFETLDFLILTEPIDAVDPFPIASDTTLSFFELTLILDSAFTTAELKMIIAPIVTIGKFFMINSLYG